MRIYYFLLSVLFACSLQAETLLLKDAVVHTISGRTLSPGNVLIEDGKISQVTTNDDLTADKTISLEGQHLYPGMIALNTSLGLAEIGGVRATRDLDEVGEFTPEVTSWVAVNPDSELLPVARANGVTLIEPTPQGGTIAGQSGLVVLDGWTVEQMAYKKPVALHVYWPAMELNITPKEKFKDKAKWKSLEDQSKEREKKIKQLDDFFADATAYASAKNSTAAPALNPSWEAMRPYIEGKLPIVVHADEFRQIKAAIIWAKEKKYKIIIAGARDAWMPPLPAMLKANDVAVIYDNIYTQPSRDFESYDVHFKAPETLRKAGVKVAFSVGSGTHDASLIKNLPYTAAQAIPFGLPAEEALKGIILFPAQILGVADRVGSIEPGKDATLFASDAEILDIRANVRHVWIAGKEIPTTSRHTRLYEKYKARPKQ